MKTLGMLFGISILLTLGLVLGTPEPVCATQDGCGLKPLKPLPPLGCKDLVARCNCATDQEGDLVCTWTWDCVPG